MRPSYVELSAAATMFYRLAAMAGHNGWPQRPYWKLVVAAIAEIHGVESLELDILRAEIKMLEDQL